MHLVDWRLGSDFNEEEASVMIKVALLCTNASASVRPPMSLVVGMLEGEVTVPASIPNNPSKDSMKIKALREHFMGSRKDETEALSQADSMRSPNETFTYFSASPEDWSMMIDDSTYFRKRG